MDRDELSVLLHHTPATDGSRLKATRAGSSHCKEQNRNSSQNTEQNQIIKVQEKPRQALGNRFIMAHPAHWIQRGELKWLEMEEYGRKGTGISPTLPCCCFPHSLISRSCRRTTPGRTGLNHHSHFSIPKNQFITHLFLAISSETQVTLLRALNKNVTAEQKESNFNSKEVKVGIN